MAKGRVHRGRKGRVKRRRMGATEQDLLLVRVEINLEEFPFFVPRKVMRKGSRFYEQTIEGENGNKVHQRWTVISSSESTLPGIFDQDVFIGTLELLERRGGMPQSGTLEFSLYELADILDVEVGGKTYADIRRSLERIALTSIRSENAFWVQGQRRFITDTFRLWDITFDESQNRKGEKRSRHRIAFGKVFMHSFRDHYLRGLDTELYWTLESPVAKRLYRLVDHKRDSSGLWVANLKELQQQIPIGPYRYPAKIREKLAGPHRELVEAGFLTAATYADREGVRYEVAGDFLRRRVDLELAGTREELIAIQLLTHSGVRGDVSRDLVAKHGPERCTRYANALPYQKNLRNPAGWLRKAIEDGYEMDEPQAELPLGSAGPRGEVVGGRTERAAAPPKAATPSSPANPVADPEAEELWEEVLAGSAEEIDAPSWRVWFEGTVPVSVGGSVLTISVPNSFAEEYISGRFKETLENHLRILRGEGWTIRIVVAGRGGDVG